MIARFVAEPPGTRALCDGRPGHPVVLGPEQLAGVRSMTGDRGARGLLAGGTRDRMRELGSGRMSTSTP